MRTRFVNDRPSLMRPLLTAPLGMLGDLSMQLSICVLMCLLNSNIEA